MLIARVIPHTISAVTGVYESCIIIYIVHIEYLGPITSAWSTVRGLGGMTNSCKEA